jgi:hypothetical protein
LEEFNRLAVLLGDLLIGFLEITPRVLTIEPGCFITLHLTGLFAYVFFVGIIDLA